MSRTLVTKWRRAAAEWKQVAERCKRFRDAEGALRGAAYARILTECAGSLERSMAITAAAKKRRKAAA